MAIVERTLAVALGNDIVKGLRCLICRLIGDGRNYGTLLNNSSAANRTLL